MDADMMAAMPANAMQGMDADMMAACPPAIKCIMDADMSGMQGMDADMMAAMPADAMLDADMMAAASRCNGWNGCRYDGSLSSSYARDGCRYDGMVYGSDASRCYGWMDADMMAAI